VQSQANSAWFSTMPTEVSMSGGAPWGFRLSGGGTQPLTVSRLTPGGKAALDGVVQGDHIIAINGQQVAGLQLGELMELIKNTGSVLHLTIISDAEVQAAEQAEHDQRAIKADLTEEHEECITQEVPEISVPEPVIEVCQEPEPVVETVQEPEVCQVQANVQSNEEEKEQMSKKEWYNLPQYIRKGIRPPKPDPEWKPQVNWMHGKLRLHKGEQSNAAVDAAGGQLRNAVMAQSGPIELKSGPINGKITHSQYNTPLQMYSDPQIVSTLMSQAVASGAEIQDPTAFQSSGVKVDTDSHVYKRITQNEKSYNSKQSRSFNILNTLLKHPYEPQDVC
jgi:hypothetical protein